MDLSKLTDKLKENSEIVIDGTILIISLIAIVTLGITDYRSICRAGAEFSVISYVNNSKIDIIQCMTNTSFTRWTISDTQVRLYNESNYLGQSQFRPSWWNGSDWKLMTRKADIPGNINLTVVNASGTYVVKRTTNVFRGATLDGVLIEEYVINHEHGRVKTNVTYTPSVTPNRVRRIEWRVYDSPVPLAWENNRTIVITSEIGLGIDWSDAYAQVKNISILETEASIEFVNFTGTIEIDPAIGVYKLKRVVDLNKSDVFIQLVNNTEQ